MAPQRRKSKNQKGGENTKHKYYYNIIKFINFARANGKGRPKGAPTSNDMINSNLAGFSSVRIHLPCSVAYGFK